MLGSTAASLLKSLKGLLHLENPVACPIGHMDFEDPLYKPEQRAATQSSSHSRRVVPWLPIHLYYPLLRFPCRGPQNVRGAMDHWGAYVLRWGAQTEQPLLGYVHTG